MKRLRLVEGMTTRLVRAERCSNAVAQSSTGYQQVCIVCVPTNLELVVRLAVAAVSVCAAPYTKVSTRPVHAESPVSHSVCVLYVFAYVCACVCECEAAAPVCLRQSCSRLLYRW